MNDELFQPVGVISKSDIEMDDRGLEKASANRQSKPKSGGAADADHSGGPFGQVRCIFMKWKFLNNMLGILQVHRHIKIEVLNS